MGVFYIFSKCLTGYGIMDPHQYKSGIRIRNSASASASCMRDPDPDADAEPVDKKSAWKRDKYLGVVSLDLIVIRVR